MNPIPLILAVTHVLTPIVSASAAEPATDGSSRPPNILFIAIDDMNDWTGFLGGHPQAKTPHMDALARKGVNFTNAHCPAPGCSPSRNALLYGVEPFHSGLYAFYDAGLHGDLEKKYTSLPRFLKENGYQTFGAGKIHHSSKGSPLEWTDYHEPQRTSLKRDLSAGYEVGKSFKMSFCPTTNPLEDHPDYQVATYGTEILGRQHGQPFFLAVGIVKPHLPFICPQRFFDLYPAKVDPPRIQKNDLADIPAVGRSMAKLRDTKRFIQDDAWNEVRRSYLACISWADFNVGRVLDALAASPHADNTIVVLWSDHGYAMGEKEHFRKFALWEETTRVPFIIHDPRQMTASAGRKVTDAVSLINIYRTLTELAGLTPPKGTDGTSLVPQLKDPSTPLATPAICTWGRGNYTLRDASFRYTRYFDGSEELYAHAKDQDEWTNQANNPEFTAAKKRLAAFLPTKEAPLATDWIAAWSVPMSADKPKAKTSYVAPSKARSDPDSKAAKKAKKKAQEKQDVQ